MPSECPCCERVRELEDQVRELEDALQTERDFRRCAEQNHDRALEDLCAARALRDAHGGWS